MPTFPGFKEMKTSVQLPSGVNYNITAEERAAGLRSTSPREGFGLEDERERR